jgi:hypothetical protein
MVRLAPRLTCLPEDLRKHIDSAPESIGFPTNAAVFNDFPHGYKLYFFQVSHDVRTCREQIRPPIGLPLFDKCPDDSGRYSQSRPPCVAEALEKVLEMLVIQILAPLVSVVHVRNA